MALGHGRLGLENCFLENKSGRIFCVRQVYFTKSCQQSGCVSDLLIYTFYTSHRVVFITHTSDRIQFFTFFQDKLHSFNIQDHRLRAWAFRETVQKIFKITYTASRFSLLTSAKFAVNINRLTLQHHKEFVVFIFYLMVFIRMCNLKSS